MYAPHKRKMAAGGRTLVQGYGFTYLLFFLFFCFIYNIVFLFFFFI